MAPKIATRTRKEVPAGKFRRTDKSKRKGTRRRYKINLKGWLKTPADWARFDAWAKINAQPRKIPEPEMPVRPSKPLSQLKKRILILSQPRKYDPSIHCRLDQSISKAALKAIPSRRLIRLAWPNIKLSFLDEYLDFSFKISPAALKYVASARIIELSQPRIVVPEECKSFEVSKSAMRHQTTERERKMALAKKLVECPHSLTDEEREELFTVWGTRRSALTYKFTSWMFILSLPSYKFLKDRKDKEAVTWKKMIIEESETRGKKALAEQTKKKSKKKRKAKKRKYEESKGAGDAKDISKDDEKTATSEEKDKEKKAKRRKIEKNAWRFEPSPCKDDPYLISQAALSGKVSPRMDELAKSRTYKDLTNRSDPFSVKKSALTATASGRIEILAKPTRPRSPIEREPPREKDEYGRPIFEKPPYGKILPKTKPYKMRDCEQPEKKKVKKKRPIDPIAFQPTVDPCIYPRQARIQKKERRRLLSSKKTGRKKLRETKKNENVKDQDKVDDKVEKTTDLKETQDEAEES